MFFLVLQILVSLSLIGCVLLQVQGSGLSSSFGGKNEVYRSKRSMEKMLVWATGVLAFLFAVLSIVLLTQR